MIKFVSAFNNTTVYVNPIQVTYMYEVGDGTRIFFGENRYVTVNLNIETVQEKLNGRR